jgi:transposase
MKAQIGIDVSKHKLDVCWLRDPETLKIKTRVFNNRRAGFEELIQWLLKQTGQPAQAVQVMMEATGVYHEALAYALHRAGFEVYVSNPHRVSEFAKSLGRRSKTDKRDSVVLARFLHSRPHRPWVPEPEEVRHLRALLSRLQALDKDIQREYNRQEKAQIQQATEQVQLSIRKVIEALKHERARLEKELDEHFDNHPGLKNDRELLKSIPGIGSVLSAEVTALLRSRDFNSARQASAYAGLVPVLHESGDSVRGPAVLSKSGAARLRAKLYMGAVVAIRHNGRIRAHYERLVAKGKTKMSALGAAMRKLLQMCFGVLKNQQGYDPQWATAAH